MFNQEIMNIALQQSAYDCTGSWDVQADGTVVLFDHDSPLVQDVIITVPVKVTYNYGGEKTVNAQVKFLAK